MNRTLTGLMASELLAMDFSEVRAKFEYRPGKWARISHVATLAAGGKEEIAVRYDIGGAPCWQRWLRAKHTDHQHRFVVEDPAPNPIR